jgi:predicted O-linked N-acetylglucosamine transferase (SPINDLY family)
MQVLNKLPTINPAQQFDSSCLIQTINYYETIIDRGDDRADNYWNLGLAYLLTERELDAQATWFIPFELASELETEALTTNLVTILDRVASQKFSDSSFEDTWSICQYLRELDPINFSNLLRSILLEIKLEQFTPNILEDWQAVEILAAAGETTIDLQLLAEVIKSLLAFPSSSVFDFIQQYLLSFPSHHIQFTEIISDDVVKAHHTPEYNSLIMGLLEYCQNLQPGNKVILTFIFEVACLIGDSKKATALSSTVYDLCETLSSQILVNYSLIRALLSAGDWKTADPFLERHIQLLELLVSNQYKSLGQNLENVLVSGVFLPCVADRPDYYRPIQNKISQIYLNHHLPLTTIGEVKPASIPKLSGVIRIGYVGATLYKHSVGWLSRWLWQHHDCEKFQIFTYSINQDSEDVFYQEWFRDRSEMSYCFGDNADETIAQIRADEIDILIDLDSLTLPTTCQILAAKPAPIQVSWLGWDATGLPTVDYFIADRYVLPDNAQDYYQEKIWRLPQSYLAVDGFEVGIPTISRESLDIPSDAIVYWSGQRGYKRHPDTVRAQMRIMKSVPNSYFLIKGDTDPVIVQEFFGRIAAEEDIHVNRLRFLGQVADEYTHRANLAIADIVLDTFPYNGATTTLETLWMGIPMVTQVGQQFAARNSYTFMLNAGIEEGIAWSQEEYIEWGIKLGLDRDLRDKIAGKLRSGRTTAPVWNAKQFTLDMEDAYRQMWAKYQAELN